MRSDAPRCAPDPHLGHAPAIAPVRRATVALLAAFVLLALVIAAHSAPSSAERTVDRALLAAPGSPALLLAQIVSFAGSTIMVAGAGVVLAVCAWKIWRNRLAAVLCLAGPAPAGVGETVMKQVVGRVRPSTSGAAGFSFPSGHTSGAAALAVVAFSAAFRLAAERRVRRRIVVGAIFYATAVGVSRVVVGDHYALDVVGGLLLGPGAAFVAVLAVLWINELRGPVAP